MPRPSWPALGRRRSVGSSSRKLSAGGARLTTKASQIVPRSALVGDTSTVHGTVDIAGLEEGQPESLAHDKPRAKRWLEPPFFGAANNNSNHAETSSSNTAKAKSKPHRASLRPLSWPIILAFMDHLQILALMWRQQQRWELPSFWLRISSPVLVFSLDGWSALQFFNAIPGLKFIVYWSEWVLLVTSMTCFWLAFIASRLPLGRKLEARCRMYAMGDLFVMPALLMSCDAARAGFWYLGVPGLGLGAWILLQQQRHASTLVLGSQKERQERYYLQKEVEWVLHVGKEWATDHIRAVTLFRSGAHHTRTWMAAWKILLVLFCETLTAYETELSVCLSILACCAGVVTMVRRTYRSRLAHHLGCVFAWTFFLNAYLSSLSAARVHSALAVVSVQTPLLIALNAGALGIGFFIAPLTAWYADKTFLDPHRSPPARSIALHLCRDETAKAWVAEVHAARATLVKHRFTPAMLYPVHEFYLHCRRLEAMLAQASRKDSVFQYTLHECLEVLYASISANQNRSMYPHQQLENCMPHLAGVATLADQELALMNPIKRRILTKLRAFSLWTAKVHGDFELGPESAAAERARLTARAESALSEASPDPALLQRLRRQLLQLGQQPGSADVAPEAKNVTAQLVKQIDAALTTQFLSLKRASTRRHVDSPRQTLSRTSTFAEEEGEEEEAEEKEEKEKGNKKEKDLEHAVEHHDDVGDKVRMKESNGVDK